MIRKDILGTYGSMSNPAYVLEWLDEWRAARMRTWAVHVSRAAREQRQNVDALKRDRDLFGRVPSWCDIDTYDANITMLEWVTLR